MSETTPSEVLFCYDRNSFDVGRRISLIAFINALLMVVVMAEDERKCFVFVKPPMKQ